MQSESEPSLVASDGFASRLSSAQSKDASTKERAVAAAEVIANALVQLRTDLRKDLEGLSGQAVPPIIVRKAFSPVIILLSPAECTHTELGWVAARKLLGYPHPNINQFLDRLENFDINRVPEDDIEQIAPFINDLASSLAKEAIDTKSPAAKALHDWAQSVYNFHALRKAILAEDPKYRYSAGREEEHAEDDQDTAEGFAEEEEEEQEQEQDVERQEEEELSSTVAGLELELQESTNALKGCLTVEALEKLSTQKKPSPLVKMTVTTLRLLLAPEGTVPSDVSWYMSARWLRKRADSLPAELLAFNKHYIPQDNIEAMRPYLCNPGFRADRVASRVSELVGCLCRFVHARVGYYEEGRKHQEILMAQEEEQAAMAKTAVGDPLALTQGCEATNIFLSSKALTLAMCAQSMDACALRTVFGNYDTDKSGFIEAKELRSMYKHMVKAVMELEVENVPIITEQKGAEARAGAQVGAEARARAEAEAGAGTGTAAAAAAEGVGEAEERAVEEGRVEAAEGGGVPETEAEGGDAVDAAAGGTRRLSTCVKVDVEVRKLRTDVTEQARCVHDLVESAMRALDVNQDGRVSWAEFQRWEQQRAASGGLMKQALTSAEGALQEVSTYNSYITMHHTIPITPCR
jgi:Ca2+-binding EF-hand superfamily protein